MSEATQRQKTVVIGAGPVGALAAIYSAQRGHNVEVYELRGDPRDPTTTPLNFTKSINLALSERGINAMRNSGAPMNSGLPGLLDKVFSETIPMRGRMIHGRGKSGEFYQQAQDYDIHGRTLFAVDRGDLNSKFLDELDSFPNVKLFFNHKLTGADFKKHKAWLENTTSLLTDSPSARHQEIEISFDFLIGCDGAHSAARYHMMKYARMDYKQEYIDTLWCEFTIPASLTTKTDVPTVNQRFRISPNHLHIWPGKDFMFIAIPSFDGSFTCTLFMPSSHFSTLSADPKSLPSFFQTYFPGVCPQLITEAALIDSFTQNPHLPLISITCSPYHYTDSAVILGDAAHAMVPFYGQGMNAGLEDVRVLFSILDEHPKSPFLSADERAAALKEYSALRTPDAHAINSLALQNYTEMRSSVTSPLYLARKWLEEKLSVWVPSLGWSTKYSRVSFGNDRYSEVVKVSEKQGRVLGWVLSGVGAGLLVGVVSLLIKVRRSLARGFSR